MRVQMHRGAMTFIAGGLMVILGPAQATSIVFHSGPGRVGFAVGLLYR